MKKINNELLCLSILVLLFVGGCVSSISLGERKDYCKDIGLEYYSDYEDGFACRKTVYINDLDFRIQQINITFSETYKNFSNCNYIGKTE